MTRRQSAQPWQCITERVLERTFLRRTQGMCNRKRKAESPLEPSFGNRKRKVRFAKGTALSDGDSAVRLHKRARQLSIKRLAAKEAGEEVFCVCNQPDTGALLMGCDGCDKWFHPRCVGNSPQQAQVSVKLAVTKARLRCRGLC